MRIMTTSDLDYVSGGDSWGGTSDGQTSYAVYYGSSPQYCSNALTSSQYGYLATTLNVAASGVESKLLAMGLTATAAYATYCTGAQ